MEIASQKPRFILILLLLAAAVALLFLPQPHFITDEMTPDSLPEAVGRFTGETMLYCQNEACLRYCESRLLIDYLCPYCNSKMDTLSPAEKRQLPADTMISRRLYRDEEGHQIVAALVSGGRQRTSFHRPQMCLPAQGFGVRQQRIVPVGSSTGGVFRVTWIDVRRAGPSGTQEASFVYWFTGNGRETPSYLQQLLWITADNLLRNRIASWAYISALADKGSTGEQDDLALKEFLIALHAALQPGTNQSSVNSDR